MVKYICKRVLLALFILLGVSLILYVLLRCMPLSYVETKFYGSNPNAQDNYAQLYTQLANCSLADTNDSDESVFLHGLDRNEQPTEVEIEPGAPLYRTDKDGNIVYRLKDNGDYEKTSSGDLIPEVEEMPIMKGYFKWLVACFRGDLGTSWKYGSPVGDVIFKNMGISFMIAFVSLILELAIAIPLGIKSACNQYGKLDYAATVLTMIGISFPSFFFGSLMIKIFAVDLGWFPSTGIQSSTITADTSGWAVFGDMAWHLVLPIFVMVVLSIGSVMRYTRTNTLEVLSADYIRTARAKGLSERSVVYKHAFRNTMIPLVTMLAGTLPGLFGGAMITENIFSIPGIGKVAYDALLEGDIPFVMGYNMFIAVLTVAGILLTDIMYAVVDPRVKLS